MESYSTNFVLVFFTQYNYFNILKCWYAYQWGIAFYCWIVFHYIDIPQFVYPFIWCWTFGVFPVLGCYWWSSCEHLVQVFRHVLFSCLLSKHLEVEYLGHVLGKCMNFSEAAKEFSKIVINVFHCIPPFGIFCIIFSIIGFVFLLPCMPGDFSLDARPCVIWLLWYFCISKNILGLYSGIQLLVNRLISLGLALSFVWPKF